MGFLQPRNLRRLSPWLHVDPLGARIVWRTCHRQHRPRGADQTPCDSRRRPAGVCDCAPRRRPRCSTSRPTTRRDCNRRWANDLARLGRLGAGGLYWNCSAPLLALGADPRQDRARRDPRRTRCGAETTVRHFDPHRCSTRLRSSANGTRPMGLRCRGACRCGHHRDRSATVRAHAA